MTRPVNIYALSRIHEERPFNIVNRHVSRKRQASRTQYHEIESLRRVADQLTREGLSVEELDGFFFGFTIPQIGKEFDLLKFSEDQCLNLELKSQAIPQEQIMAQLVKNRYYLRHLGRETRLYTAVTDALECWRLDEDGALRAVTWRELADAVRALSDATPPEIDRLFRPSVYLVSPNATPERFIQGEYFLTQAQEQVKRAALEGMAAGDGARFFHITGKPGTGKTLVLYDIARTLAQQAPTLMVHCGRLSPGQEMIREAIDGLEIVPASELRQEDAPPTKYRYVLVDEAHRMPPPQLERLCDQVRSAAQSCLFCTDPGQVLSTAEKRNNIVGRLRRLPLQGEYVLSERLRANAEITQFVQCLKNLNHRAKLPRSLTFDNVAVNYANTIAEAQNLIAYYRKNGYVFINYAKARWRHGPYEAFDESFDAHHVIGQEYDQVVMLMDHSFYYDGRGMLRGIPKPNPNYLYPNLFYQGITRVRERLSLIVVRAPRLFDRIVSLLKAD